MYGGGMTEEELKGQIEWFESLKEMLERKEYPAVKEAIQAALNLLERGIRITNPQTRGEEG